MTLKLGWFSTGRGPGSRGLFEFILGRIDSRELDAKIEFVFCNREAGEYEATDQFFHLVRSHHIPLVTLSSRKLYRRLEGNRESKRLEFDRRAMDMLKDWTPDPCVLAGYMRIVGPEMCHKYPMLNLHPALPGGPVGTWQEVVWRLIETRAAETGAMMHLATEDLDGGPVVSYFSFPLRRPEFDDLWREVEGKPVQDLKAQPGEGLPLFQRIRQEGYRREPYLLLETLKSLASGDIRIRSGRVLDSGGRPREGLCLNTAIEKHLALEAER